MISLEVIPVWRKSGLEGFSLYIIPFFCSLICISDVPISDV